MSDNMMSKIHILTAECFDLQGKIVGTKSKVKMLEDEVKLYKSQNDKLMRLVWLYKRREELLENEIRILNLIVDGEQEEPTKTMKLKIVRE